MSPKDIPSQFAPAEREPADVLERQSSIIKNQKELRSFMDAVPDIFIVLNDKRQVVFYNQALLDFLGKTDDRGVLGFRPGEILNCIHAFTPDCSCGTTEFCQQCGSVQAILESLDGEKTVQECRLVQKEGTLNLRIYATPYHKEGCSYSLVVISDISHEKRRITLERIFYHDVLNTATGLLGFSQLLRRSGAEKIAAFSEKIYQLTQRLVEEINGQRELSKAEHNELTVYPVPLRSMTVLGELVHSYKEQRMAGKKKIVIDPDSQDVEFQSDCILINRVLGNLLKNALEASRSGETVTLRCMPDDKGVRFHVHNPGLIPREVQLQIYQRSFSTKAAGRGLGTYSIRLLSERYLNGVVSFTSTEEEGTEFILKYPLELKSS